MRNLTIKRQKTFVACLAKMKVYIEDPIGGGLTIDGVVCRLLGTLKNGEEKTFEIDNEERRVYVIADRLSKGFCNDYYTVPAGEGDVDLCGKNYFNPATGNAFRFDGVDDTAILENRKRGLRIGIFVLIGSVLLGVLIGLCSNRFTVALDKVFEVDNMNITLNSRFAQGDIDGFAACYGTDDVSIFVVKESFSLMDGLQDYRLDEYGDLVLEANGHPADSIKSEDGVTYFDYHWTNPDTNDTYYYFTTLHKGTDAFWIVSFTTLSKNETKYRDDFVEWAKSVSFEDS